MINETYLEVVCEARSPEKMFSKFAEANLVITLKAEARVAEELPDLTGFRDTVDHASRLDPDIATDNHLQRMR